MSIFIVCVPQEHSFRTTANFGNNPLNPECRITWKRFGSKTSKYSPSYNVQYIRVFESTVLVDILRNTQIQSSISSHLRWRVTTLSVGNIFSHSYWRHSISQRKLKHIFLIHVEINTTRTETLPSANVTEKDKILFNETSSSKPFLHVSYCLAVSLH